MLLIPKTCSEPQRKRPGTGAWQFLKHRLPPTPPIPLLTLLNGFFDKLLEQTQGSLVDHHGDALLQGLQEGSQGHGSRWAVRLLRRLVSEMCGKPGGDEDRAVMGQRQSGPSAARLHGAGA